MAKDLSGYLAEIDDLLLRVRRPVAIDHLAALISQARRPILFDQIEGFPGYRVCDLLFRDRAAQARVIGTRPAELLPELARRMRLAPRKPRLVNGGPVKAQKFTGEEIDIRALPGFKHGANDPGRSLIAMTLCRDPDNGHVNFAFTRLTPMDARRATYLIGSSPHMRATLEKYERASKPMPIALVIGSHPAYEIMASYSVPTHLDEWGELDIVGNILGETVDLVPCEVIPLEVPAEAEIVIEGWVQPGARADDPWGPSQYLYYHPGASRQPVFEAVVMTTRDRPILRQHATTPYTDHQTLLSLPHEAILHERLTELGLRLHDVHYVPWGGTLTCVIKMTPEYDGQVRDALMFVLGSRWPSTKMAIAIDDDIAIESAEDLHWCLATRVDPERDVFIVPGARGHRGDPSSRPIDNAPGRTTVGKWGIDATKPPLNRAAERAKFTRANPHDPGEVSLAALIEDQT